MLRELQSEHPNPETARRAGVVVVVPRTTGVRSARRRLRANRVTKYLAGSRSRRRPTSRGDRALASQTIAHVRMPHPSGEAPARVPPTSHPAGGAVSEATRTDRLVDRIVTVTVLPSDRSSVLIVSDRSSDLTVLPSDRLSVLTVSDRLSDLTVLPSDRSSALIVSDRLSDLTVLPSDRSSVLTVSDRSSVLTALPSDRLSVLTVSDRSSVLIVRRQRLVAPRSGAVAPKVDRVLRGAVARQASNRPRVPTRTGPRPRAVARNAVKALPTPHATPAHRSRMACSSRPEP